MRRAGGIDSLALLAPLMAAGCSAQLSSGHQNLLNYGGALNARMPVTSMLERRFLTVVRQQYDFSCGSAALATLLHYHYDDPQDEQTVFLGMWREGDRAQIRKLGFSLLDMKRYLAGRGIGADGYRVTVAQIAKARVPGIALINLNGYRHFVVVKGIESGSVLLGDPSLGIRRERLDTFLKQWNGVFFVLNAKPEVAQRHYNQASDLALTPNGRFGAEADPLSLTALALMRPVVASPVLTEF